MNHELPGVQSWFRKCRGTRNQIANILWIIKKARGFQKNIYFCFIDYAKAFDCVHHNKLWKILKECNITRKGGGTKNTTECLPNCNFQWRSSPDAHVHHQRAEAGQGGRGCMLRVRTGSECPEEILRELMWDSNPNCGIARERKIKRERSFLQKALT